MADGVLNWAKQQRKIWIREMGMLKSGKKNTSEIRRGKRVDTTTGTLADLSVRLSELDALILRHETRNAKGPQG